MLTDVIQAQFRERVHDLVAEHPAVAEEVALAVVKGVAQGFREISEAAPADVNRRLLAALDLDVPTVVATLGH